MAWGILQTNSATKYLSEDYTHSGAQGCGYRKRKRNRKHYTPVESPLSLREDEDNISAAAEVRRCRFIATEPPAALPPIRLVGDRREPESPLDIPPVVEDRGRVEDAANFGRDEPPFRELLCGVPDARFLASQRSASVNVQSI